MLKFFLFSSYILNALSQTTLPLVGGSRDVNNCLVSAGYTWCESSQNCIRQWETSCKDNYINCNDCLTQQRNGINIACPENCDMIAIAVDPMPPVYYPPAPMPTPQPVVSPEPSVSPRPASGSNEPTVVNPFIRTPCPDVMCMMFCPDGNQLDDNGCQLCQCNDPSPQSQECPLTQPSCEGYNYVCPKITEITHCNMDGIDGYTTYQLSLVVQPNMNVKNIYAIYGNNEDSLTMSFPPVYQSPIYQGQNLGGVSDYMISMFPDTQFDSWFTIGLTNGDPQGTLSSIGIDFTQWDETNGLDVTDGAIFVMNPSNTDLTDQGNEIVIAQITIPTYTSPTIVVNVQGKTIDYLPHDVKGKSWTEKNILFPIVPPVYNAPDTVPENCVSWFDGCNTCSVNNGILGGCTRMMCFREDTPRCLQYTANVISGH